MKVSQVYPSKYVKGEDLKEREVTLTIKAVTMEKMMPTPGEETEEMVVWFRGTDKGYVLNKTNATTIAKLHGDDTDDWTGKRIILYPKNIFAFGKWQVVANVKSVLPPAPIQQEKANEPDGDESST